MVPTGHAFASTIEPQGPKNSRKADSFVSWLRLPANTVQFPPSPPWPRSPGLRDRERLYDLLRSRGDLLIVFAAASEETSRQRTRCTIQLLACACQCTGCQWNTQQLVITGFREKILPVRLRMLHIKLTALLHTARRLQQEQSVLPAKSAIRGHVAEILFCSLQWI